MCASGPESLVMEARNAIARLGVGNTLKLGWSRRARGEFGTVDPDRVKEVAGVWLFLSPQT